MSSTIQAYASLLQAESGLNASSVIQYNAQEDAITMNSIAVTTTPEALAFGDVVTPRKILLKLVSGDDLLVSVNGGSTYPLSLSGLGDVSIFGLDSRTVSAITTIADVSGSLGGKHFVIYDINGPVWPWLDTGNGAGTYATGNLISSNTNPSDGHTATIGVKTYTFKTALTPTEGQVLIGATADDTLLNFINAINHTGTPGTDYSCAAANTQVAADGFITAHSFNVTALVVGSAANAIATTSGSPELSWTQGATLIGGLQPCVEPVVSGERLLPVSIANNDSANTVADKVAAALDADEGFICPNPAAATLSITDANPGPRTTITAGDSGFTSPSAAFTAPATVYLKSMSTSQVVVAIAPA